MKIKVILVITVIALIIVTLFNNKFLPLRREISDMEIVTIAGLDKVGDKYMITLIKKDNSDSAKGDGEDSLGKNQIISMTADSYSVALRQLQTVTDKFTTSSHIKYYIVGEETLQDNFEHVTDAIARGYQTRLNSKIYLAKGMTARAFLEEASKMEFEVQEKLENMENNFWQKGSKVNTDVLDFGNISFANTGQGLVDTLEIYDTIDEKKKNNMEVSIGTKEESKNEMSFGYGGTAIINNCKIVGFLNKEQTAIANYILNKDNVNVITVYDKENFVVFRIEDLNTNLCFSFDENDLLTNIKIKVAFKANYEETNATIPIFTQNMIDYFEKKLNEQVEKQIKDILYIENEYKVDFLRVSEKLELKHPYKYRVNENNFMEILKKSKIEVESTGIIQTTYDVVESNKDQKGANK